MTYRSRERVAIILNHREADRVPIHIQDGIVVQPCSEDPDYRDFCLQGDFEMLKIEPPVDREVFAGYLGDLPQEAEMFSYWGVAKIAKKTGLGHHAGHRTFHPLQNIDSEEELRAYPFPDIASSGADRGLEEKVLLSREKEYTVIGQMSQTILETAYELRGLPELMMDFYERPGYVDTLFQKIAEQRKFQARRFAEAGVDVLRIGDDIATQKNLLVSPRLYRERIKPYHASVIQAARRVNPGIHVLYHSDGNLTRLLPDLLDIGVTAINPVQPECMDTAQIKADFGSDLTLWGCMPTQSVYANGSREDVINHLHFLMEEIAPGGGLVVNFINTIMTETVVDNLRVFNQVFYELGRYKTLGG
jgi:uroporphyrinogen decarboxylase